MLRQDDVVILVDESMMDITIQLGGSSHAVRKTGQVLSDKVQLSYSRPPLGSDIATINESKRTVLENAFENTSDDLYDSFVEAFGEDVIRSDNR